MFCWHRWKVVENTEQPSAAEQDHAAGIYLGEGSLSIVALKAYYGRPVIVTYRCSKYGAETVERV